jgi:uncharacterized sulfatase
MTKRSNFLFLVGEDTGRVLGCYGDRYAKTPNLDRLASQGCRFDQAWTVAPVCAPSRSALVTGEFPIKTGTHQMRSKRLNPPRLFTQELRDAGYHVTWPTKLDFNFEAPEGEGGWRDDADEWEDRLRNGELSDGPFLAFYNIGVTHESGMWPDGVHPAGKGASRRGGGWPRPEAVSDPDEAPVMPYHPDTPIVREDVARHYDNLHALDQKVGDLLDALDASGQADNTMVVFLADHGRGLPREKRWCYPAGLHMPLIVRWPGHVKPNSVSDELVSWVDLAPTFLALAGIDKPDNYDGRIFLGDDTEPEPAYAFHARDRMDEAFDLVRTCTDGRWFYVHNGYPQIRMSQRTWYMEAMPTVKELRRLDYEDQLDAHTGIWMSKERQAEELYDLQTDPNCLRNLASDPGREAIRQRMNDAVEAWRERCDDKGRHTERELAEQGLVEDQVDSYRARLDTLPPPYSEVTPPTVTEPSDLEAVYGG